LFAFIQKYYSFIHCSIDSVTYFTHQNINRISISHKNNYCTMLLHGSQT